MAYRIFDVELTEALPNLYTSEGETGIALLLRRRGRPIHFWMEVLPPNHVLTACDVLERMSEESKARVLREAVRDELGCAAPTAAPLPSVTVAICTRDRPETLARCLNSLHDCETAPLDPTRVELLVVDNAPSDPRTRSAVQSYPRVRYVVETKPGLNFARNRALTEAVGELIAFVDDDVTVDRYWLQGLLEAWTENPDAAAFTGLVLPYELATRAQIIFERRGGFRRGFDKIRYGRTLPGASLYPCGAGIFGAGANMAFRRDALMVLGGFDVALDTGAALPGGGDLDIFYRVIRAGFPLAYEPRYLVFHQHRRELAELRRQYGRSWGLAFMAFVAKWSRADRAYRAKWRRLMAWWFAHELKQLVKSLIGHHAVPPQILLAELCGGVQGMFGAYSRSLRRAEKIRKQFARGDTGLSK
jgi:GT2 family glycosyltransferase